MHMLLSYVHRYQVYKNTVGEQHRSHLPPGSQRTDTTIMEGLIDNAKKFMASEEGQKMQATFGM